MGTHQIRFHNCSFSPRPIFVPSSSLSCKTSVCYMCVFFYVCVCVCACVFVYVCVRMLNIWMCVTYICLCLFYVWVWRCVIFECVSKVRYKQNRIAEQSVDDNIEIPNMEAGFVSLCDIWLFVSGPSCFQCTIYSTLHCSPSLLNFYRISTQHKIVKILDSVNCKLRILCGTC